MVYICFAILCVIDIWLVDFVIKLNDIVISTQEYIKDLQENKNE